MTRRTIRFAALLPALFVATTAAHGGAGVVLVDDDAAPGGDGQTWGTAFGFLQDALAFAADPVNGATEVRVAQGLYRPDRDGANPGGTGDRAATFSIPSGVSLRGGFAGIGAVDPDALDPVAFETVLDGDLLGDDPLPVLFDAPRARPDAPAPGALSPGPAAASAAPAPGFGNVSDNAYHVVSALGLGTGVELTGVTISGGHFEDAGTSFGGAGLIVDGGDLHVEACVFRRNLHTATGIFNSSGAGAAVSNGELTVSACLFESNFASTNGSAPGLGGAGLYAIESNATVRDTVFRDNVAGRGGAIRLLFSELTADGCAFEANRGGGGAIYVRGSSMVVSRCDFTGNTFINQGGSRHGGSIHFDGSTGLLAEGFIINCAFRDGMANRGGAIYAASTTVATIANCLFTGSTALSGGGVAVWGGDITIRNSTFSGNTSTSAQGGGCFNLYGDLDLSNCVLWGNTPAQLQTGNAIFPVTADWSLVEGGWPGAANIDGEPLFVDPASGDFRLGEGSPAIDAGFNLKVPADVPDLDGDGDTMEPLPVDLAGDARFADDPEVADTGLGLPPIVDMGAFERPPSVVAISLDVKPGSCPNPFNRASNGVLPVAAAGTPDLDVSTIDVSTLLLARADGVGAGVAPLDGPPGPHTVVDDVASPFGGEPCACHEANGDGIDDLSMKFDRQDLVAALELDELSPGAVVELVLTGAMLDGTPLSGSDCVRLVPPGSSGPPAGDGGVGDVLDLVGSWGDCDACPWDLNDDGTVDGEDLAALLRAEARSR
jgi:hypothetical protein